MLETPVFESLYGGQLTLSTQLIKPNYLVMLPTDAAPQFLWKLTPSIHYQKVNDEKKRSITMQLNDLRDLTLTAR